MAGSDQRTIRAGDRFEHARQLDPDWRPGPGQRYTDAPHVIMVVTRVVRQGDYTGVWYRPVGTRGRGFVANSWEMHDGGDIVGRWL